MNWKFTVIGAALLLISSGVYYGTAVRVPEPVPLDLIPEWRAEVRVPVPTAAEIVITTPTVAAATAPTVLDAPPCCMKMSWRFPGVNGSVDFVDETITFVLYDRTTSVRIATEIRTHISGRVLDQAFIQIMPRAQFFGPDWLGTLERSNGKTEMVGELTVVNGFGGVDENGNIPPVVGPSRRRAVPIPVPVPGKKRAVPTAALAAKEGR